MTLPDEGQRSTADGRLLLVPLMTRSGGFMADERARWTTTRASCGDRKGRPQEPSRWSSRRRGRGKCGPGAESDAQGGPCRCVFSTPRRLHRLHALHVRTCVRTAAAQGFISSLCVIRCAVRACVFTITTTQWMAAFHSMSLSQHLINDE